MPAIRGYTTYGVSGVAAAGSTRWLSIGGLEMIVTDMDDLSCAWDVECPVCCAGIDEPCSTPVREFTGMVHVDREKLANEAEPDN
jgi:hypothetical protein